ncbi:MAG: hypothetical protein GC162_03940 [Planctomycetes bacterium]|nr:hypothetical protein [Planctomycetota bacterium]
MTLFRTHRLLALLVGAAGLCATGCSSGPRNFENDNDRLRKENTALTEKVAQLSDHVAGLEKQLQAEQSRRGVKLPESLVIPACTKITIDRYSGRVDDALRLYLSTLDAKGRFVQTIGRVSISVVAIEAGKEATVLGSTTIEAKDFDAAYRAGLTGTHYTLMCRVPGKLPEGVTEVTVKVTLDDLVTGQSLSVTKNLAWPAK